MAAFGVATLVAGGRGAQADRYSRGEASFGAACASCHSVGWEKPSPVASKVDITDAARRLSPAALGRFLADPSKERPSTGCHHPPLGRQPVADLMTFLARRAQGQPGPQVVPPPSPMRKPHEPPERASGSPARGGR